MKKMHKVVIGICTGLMTAGISFGTTTYTCPYSQFVLNNLTINGQYLSTLTDNGITYNITRGYPTSDAQQNFGDAQESITLTFIEAAAAQNKKISCMYLYASTLSSNKTNILYSLKTTGGDFTPTSGNQWVQDQGGVRSCMHKQLENCTFEAIASPPSNDNK